MNETLEQIAVRVSKQFCTNTGYLADFRCKEFTKALLSDPAILPLIAEIHGREPVAWQKAAYPEQLTNNLVIAECWAEDGWELIDLYTSHISQAEGVGEKWSCSKHLSYRLDCEECKAAMREIL